MLILRLSLIMAVSVVVLGAHGSSSSVPAEFNNTSSTEGSDEGSDDRTFESEWKISDITLNQISNISFQAVNPGIEPPPDIVILAQTGAGRSEPITEANTWEIVQLQKCTATNCTTVEFVLDPVTDNPMSFTFALQEPAPQPLFGYFFCIGNKAKNGHSVCHSYSRIFSINSAREGSNPSKPHLPSVPNNDEDASNLSTSIVFPVQTATPISVLTMQTTIPYISFARTISPSVPAFTSTLVVATETSSPTTTPNSVGSTVVEPSAGGGGRSKLSVGAVVGIALGAFVLAVLIVMAVLFFCRRSQRRRRTRLDSGAGRGPVMFAGSMDGASNSREIFNDKDAAVQTLIHPNSNDSSFLLQDSNNRHSVQRHTFSPEGAAAYRDSPQDSAVVGISAHDSPTLRDTEHSDHENESQPLQRHADLSPYDTASSAPYTGIAASPPRRKPTTASHKTAVSALSHSLSNSSARSSQPPHSPSAQYTDFHHPSTHQHVSQLRNIGEEGGASSIPNASATNPEEQSSSSSENTRTTTANSSSGSRQLHSSSSNNNNTQGEPRYGDTRHTPQVFTHHHASSSTGGGGGGATTTTTTRQSPFLSEPGMSPEEVARLEEEEARIDAAILAADEARRNRPGSGLR